MTDPETEDKKRKFWEVDPSIFKPGPKDSWMRKYFIEPARTIARFTFLLLFFAYPLFLVVGGLVFGAIFFWGFLLGSVGLIGLLLWKLGYAANFAAWNPNLRKQLVGLAGGFTLTLIFWLTLTTLASHQELAIWAFAVIGGLVIIAVGFLIRRVRE